MSYSYYKQKAKGECPSHAHTQAMPGHVYCVACVAAQRGYSRDYAALGRTPEQQYLYEHREALKTLRPIPEPTEGQYIAHCGRWHKLTALPMTLPCCGWVAGV